jgi:hypothetical protein
LLSSHNISRVVRIMLSDSLRGDQVQFVTEGGQLISFNCSIRILERCFPGFITGWSFSSLVIASFISRLLNWLQRLRSESPIIPLSAYPSRRRRKIRL